MDYEEYFRHRLAVLMDQGGISAYKLSAMLGHGKNYITKILSGECLPKLKDFFMICEKLDITPKEFFDNEVSYPHIIKNIHSSINRLGEDELDIILPLIKRLEK